RRAYPSARPGSDQRRMVARGGLLRRSFPAGQGALRRAALPHAAARKGRAQALWTFRGAVQRSRNQTRPGRVGYGLAQLPVVERRDPDLEKRPVQNSVEHLRDALVLLKECGIKRSTLQVF